MKAWRRLAMCLGFLALAADGNSQPYSLASSTIDGGGGTSSGGSYSLTGTIGQPDGGTLSGGSYTLQGGFWPGMTTVTIPGGPTLFIEPLGQRNPPLLHPTRDTTQESRLYEVHT